MKPWIRATLGGLAVFLSITSLALPAMAQQRVLFPQGLHQQSAQPARGMTQRSASARLPAQFQRQTVGYRGSEKPGTIIVHTRDKFLYLILGDGKAMRYGIGTARTGFEWSGTHRVTAKKEWPGWTPPAAMRKRQPELPAYMPGGPANPLGARALYLGSTLYRIHGTNEPLSIGQNVSSGCIRMVNEDVMDLYQRVGIGARVIVL